jgi:hypothetical protein
MLMAIAIFSDQVQLRKNGSIVPLGFIPSIVAKALTSTSLRILLICDRAILKMNFCAVHLLTINRIAAGMKYRLNMKASIFFVLK